MAEMLTWVMSWEAARWGRLKAGELNPFPVSRGFRIIGFWSYFSSWDWTPGTKLYPMPRALQQQPCRGPAFGKVPLPCPSSSGQRFASPMALVFTLSRAGQEHQLPTLIPTLLQPAAPVRYP